MRRILCAWFPDWPLDRLARARRGAPNGSRPFSGRAEGQDGAGGPGTGLGTGLGSGLGGGAPFALTEAGVHGVRIAAACGAARALGIAPGLTLADARARAPGIVTETIDREADAAVLSRLVLWLTRYTPVAAEDVTEGPEGPMMGAMLDVTGCAHLWGGETGMLADLSTRLDRAGVAHRLGLAATPGAAWALAHEGREALTIVEGLPGPGIADLPVAGLRLSGEALTRLRRFGLTRIGQLMGIDRRALARRFASRKEADRVALRLDQAMGLRAEPLKPLAPPAEHAVRLPCPEPILDRDGIAAGLERLMAELERDLEAAGEGARRFVLRAYRSDGTVAEAAVRTARPERAPEHLGRLFAERLDRIDPGFGIDHLGLSAEGTGPMEASTRPLGRGLGGDEADPAALSALADRLTTRLGEGAVETLGAAESHLPERAERRAPFAGVTEDRRGAALGEALAGASPETLGGAMLGAILASAEAGPAAPRPLRLIDPAEPIEVVAEIPEGPPMRFVWRRVSRRVTRADGPERIGPEWWRTAGGGTEPPRTRDYYRVEDETGRRYWLYRDGLYGDGRGAFPAWYIQGLFA